MKKFVMFAGLLGAMASLHPAQAQQFSNCSAYLEDQYGRILEQFDIRDGNYNNACNVALSQCQNAQTQRSEYTYCRLADGGYENDNYPRYPRVPGGDRYTHRCVASLKSRPYGQVVNTYYGTGFSPQEACQNAQYQCLNEAQRYSGLYCEAVPSSRDDGRNPYPPRRPYPRPIPGDRRWPSPPRFPR
jgi:hypothetical protein